MAFFRGNFAVEYMPPFHMTTVAPLLINLWAEEVLESHVDNIERLFGVSLVPEETCQWGVVSRSLA